MADQPTGSVFEEQAPTQASQEQASQQQKGQAPSQEEQQQQPASSDSVFADQLASIKNERGEPKYKDLPTALEALKHSQEYIPNLKQENETLKEKVERMEREAQERKNLEETLERLTSQQQQPTPQEYQGLTEEQVAGLLEQRLAQREQEQKAQSNSQQVEQAIVQRYGDKAREVVAAKAAEYDMSPAEMQAWAQKNPKAVLALFDVKSSPQGNQRSPGSSVNIPPVNPKPSDDLEAPDKSLLRGATSKEQMEYMRKVKEYTKRRLGVES